VIEYAGINHLAMVTGNMDATIRYWRDLLGLRLVLTSGRPGYRQYFFELPPSSMITFFEWPDVEPGIEKDHGAPIQGKVTFDHVSIGVRTKDSLWQLKDMLDAAGFWVSEVVDHGFIWSLYSFDPNNIPVEFSCYTKDVDLRSNPVFAEKQPSPIVLEGSEPQAGKWPAVTDPTPEEEKRKVYPGAGKELFGTP
jgi:catechol 2,3-dioxygenase-like lactoylglutathione lyase family enzyme